MCLADARARRFRAEACKVRPLPDRQRGCVRGPPAFATERRGANRGASRVENQAEARGGAGDARRPVRRRCSLRRVTRNDRGAPEGQNQGPRTLKRSFVLTPEAKADLRETLFDIAEDSPETAERLRFEVTRTESWSQDHPTRMRTPLLRICLTSGVSSSRSKRSMGRPSRPHALLTAEKYT